MGSGAGDALAAVPESSVQFTSCFVQLRNAYVQNVQGHPIGNSIGHPIGNLIGNSIGNSIKKSGLSRYPFYKYFDYFKMVFEKRLMSY